MFVRHAAGYSCVSSWLQPGYLMVVVVCKILGVVHLLAFLKVYKLKI